MTDKQYRLKMKKSNNCNNTLRKAGAKLEDANEHIADVLIDTNKKIEKNVIGTYQKIETAFIDKFLEEIPKNESKNQDK